MQEVQNLKKLHTLTLENRKNIKITGVDEMGTFDDSLVTVFTSVGELSIKGKNLHISNLNLERGELLLEGDIDSFFYSDNYSGKGGFLSKIFK